MMEDRFNGYQDQGNWFIRDREGKLPTLTFPTKESFDSWHDFLLDQEAEYSLTPVKLSTLIIEALRMHHKYDIINHNVRVAFISGETVTIGHLTDVDIYENMEEEFGLFLIAMDEDEVDDFD